MLNKSKSYPILLLLLMWGIMSASSCQGCDNALKGTKRHKPLPERPLTLEEQIKLINAVANGQVGSPALVQLIKQGRMGLKAKDEQGRNAIQHIIHNGTTLDELESVLQQGKQEFPNREIADQEIAKILNTPDNSPRHDTAFTGAVESMGEKRDKKLIKLVDILFQHGAKPSPEERKRSLLYCLKLSGLETSETNSGLHLFKHLAKEFQRNKLPLDQATVRMIANMAARTGNDGVLQYVLENPAIFPIDAASKDEQGNTLLHYAAAGAHKNSVHVIDLLLKLNPAADYVNQVNERNESALHLAVRCRSVAVVRALIKASADLNLRNKVVKDKVNNDQADRADETAQDEVDSAKANADQAGEGEVVKDEASENQTVPDEVDSAKANADQAGEGKVVQDEVNEEEGGKTPLELAQSLLPKQPNDVRDEQPKKKDKQLLAIIRLLQSADTPS